MICVNKVWKLIWNNYDVIGNPENLGNLELVWKVELYRDQFLSTLIIVSYC